MLSRSIINEMTKWKGAVSRKPLVLRGARQVGKTVAARMFGETYERFTELNLERSADASFFKRGLSASEIIQAIKLREGIPGDSPSWLLFLDEIQECPEAVSMLRYFYEELPHIHVLAAGSLLEIALQRKHVSFPVGRVEFRYLYPMNFEEFLAATAEPGALEVYNEIPSPAYAEESLFQQYHRYALIGGMPEAVAEYAVSRDVPTVNRVYENLFTSYVDDIPKYARNESGARVLRHCLRAAPLQAGSRISFAGFGESNYGSREAGEALRILEQVMLISLLYPTTSIQAPFALNGRKSPRLQFIDTGLLHYLSGVQQEMLGIKDLSDVFRGRIMEQLTGQELMARQVGVRHAPLFWVRDKTQSQAELDFLEVRGIQPVPVEVKSGAAGKLRSLHQFMERCPSAKVAIRLYRGGFLPQDVSHQAGGFRLLNIPYYHASKIDAYLGGQTSSE